MDKQIAFLNAAISDAQDLIRFIDTKTTVVISLLAAYVVAFFSIFGKIVEYSSKFSCLFWCCLIVFIFCLIICIIITLRIIIPTNHPAENIKLGDSKQPKIKFFLTPNTYPKGKLYRFINSNKFKLSLDFSEYVKQMKNVKEEEIIDSLSFELFKVNYIRNIKNDRFNSLIFFLIITTIVFFIAYSIYSIESYNLVIQNIKVTKP
jgi:hypothetical protein